MTSATFYMVGLLVDGFSASGVCVLSDLGVGFAYVVAFICAGCCAIPCYVSPCYFRSSINVCSVDDRSCTSCYSYRMVATIFVCDWVDGGVSIYSTHFALCLAFSYLLFIL